MTPSTKSLDALPNPLKLQRLCISIALLDEILCPEWDYRYFSFDPAWAPGERMASMRNGSGDDYFIGFSAAGALIVGFAHEALMSPHREGARGELWDGMFAGVPPSLDGFRNEPAFSPDDTTFCLWWDVNAPGWRTGVTDWPSGDDPDGSEQLLFALDGRPETYQQYASEYFEIEVDLSLIEHVFHQDPLSRELILSINPDADADEILRSAETAGYGK